MNSLALYRWRKVHETEKFLGETFLREREKFCVSACARFRNLNFVEDHAWVFASNTLKTAAMLLHSGQTIFPVFNGIQKIDVPAHLCRALANIRIHALHGLSDDVETLIEILVPLGVEGGEIVDYHLMSLDDEADLRPVRSPPAGLTLRRPKAADIEPLLPLQAAYEREEVLPTGAVLDPACCRLNVERIVAHEIALVAELDGQIVGKINTNAEAYSRCQIGGVYVLPAYREQGIASCMTGAFARFVLSRGRGMTLYVRKSNTAALRTYGSTGFKTEADYRIVYR